MNSFLKKSWPHILAILIFLGLTVAYFTPQIEGKVIIQSDMMQYKGMSEEIRNHKKATGETTLWTNAMFGGMPTYQINTVNAGNNLFYVTRLLRLGIPRPIGRFFTAMLGFYILMLSLGANSRISIAGAIGYGFMTNNLVLFEAGHISKLEVLSFMPLLAAGVILIFKRKYLSGGALFALGSGLVLYHNHPQMAYYLFLTLVIYGIAQFIYDLRKGKLPGFFKSIGVLLAGGLIALGASFSNLWVTMEYAEDTMRGKPILEIPDDGTPKSSSETEGLDWEYAMGWSNGTLDCFASFIPGLVGGGTQEPVDASSASFKSLRSQGYNVREPITAPLYWGKLPFTSGPAYLGAVMVLLFLMGMILIKGPMKWWLVLGTLLTFMLSMGKNLEGFNHFLFDYFPLFNKFRTPNSVLSITSMLVPLLAFFTLDHIVKGKSTKKEILNSLYIAVGIGAAICIYFLLAGANMYDFAHPSDPSRAPFDPQALAKDRAALMQSDSLRTLIIVLLSGGLIWAFVQNKIKELMLIAGLGVIVLFDFWTVGKRYLNEEDFVKKSRYEANFAPRPADTQILQDTDPNYRVYDASESTFHSTKASFFHKSIGGYHAAKLQRFQDLVDHHISKGNQKVLDMLNTKYFILPGQPQGSPAQAQQNPGALGNAWFVSNIQMVPNANAEIDALEDIDPKEVAVVHEEYSDYVSDLSPTKNGSIVLTEYQPNQLTYQSNTTSEQFAVFSEIWYGPDKGWKVTIDGEPVEHVRSNYALRGMKVPAGQHTIIFSFDPRSYKVGRVISFIFSSLIILSILFIGYQNRGKWLAKEEAPAPVKATPKPKGKPKKGKGKK